MKNIELSGQEKISLQRKGALLSWTGSSNYYYLMEELDISPLLKKRNSLANQSGSFQAIFIGLLANCAAKHDFFYHAVFGQKIYRRLHLVVSTLVSFDKEIAGSIRLQDPHLKSLDEIRAELAAGKAKLKKGTNVPGWLNHVPMLLLSAMMRLTFFLMYSFNYWAAWLPLERDVIGAMVVSNVGAAGSSSWIVPQQNRYHAPPCSIVYGRAEGNKLKVTFGFDHRIADGRHSMEFVDDVKQALASLTS